ncbi:MAG: ATP-grasp domain-containing protein [Deltaproteobacteria bacterium]|nr:ATP-grasp domain-containing protein [Deltaproteobacteria bacterium]
MPVKGKTILIISGGVEAVPIIERAKALGLKVAVSDGNPDAPGFRLADFKIIASTYDEKKTAELAFELNEAERIDGVMAAAADVPLTVAAVAERLKLPGISVNSARIVADKLLMKETFSASGVPVPWFSQVRSAVHLEKLLWEKKTLVIKPVDSRGARGVVRLVEGVDIAWAFDEAMKNSPSCRVMAEEWVNGRQISTESIITPDGVITPGLSDRNYEQLERFAPFVIEDGGDLPAILTVDERAGIDRIIGKVARAIGMKSGTIKGDIVIGESGPVVIEVAARLSGGYFCSHTIPLSTGTDFVGAAILLALGEEIGLNDFRPKAAKAVCQRFLFPEPGIVRKVYVPEMQEESLAMLKVYVKVGDEVKRITSHPCRAGMAVTTGDTREGARAAIKRVFDRVTVVVEPGIPV